MPYADKQTQRAFQRVWTRDKLKRLRIEEEIENPNQKRRTRSAFTEQELKEINRAQKIKTYKGAVRLATQYVGRRPNRMALATLAIKACYIRHGGARYTPEQSKRTIVAFARDIGVNHKTINDWIKIKLALYDKLPEEEQKLNFDCFAAKTALESVEFRPNVMEHYLELTNRLGMARTVSHIIKYARCLYSSILRNGLGGFNEKQMAQLIQYVDFAHLQVHKT